MLCAGPYGYYYSLNDTINMRLGYDDRRDYGTGDWDVGYIKGECNYESSVAGISQDANGVVMNLKCNRTGYAAQTNQCYTLQFGNSDNRRSYTWGDWDRTFKKNQCSDSTFVKGVSTFANGQIKSILCCPF